MWVLRKEGKGAPYWARPLSLCSPGGVGILAPSPLESEETAEVSKQTLERKGLEGEVG